MSKVNDTASLYPIERVLEALLTKSLSKFEAEANGDHDLNMTIFTLCYGYDLLIEDKWVKIKTKHGRCRMKRYRLQNGDHRKARQVLQRLHEQRTNLKRYASL